MSDMGCDLHKHGWKDSKCDGCHIGYALLGAGEFVPGLSPEPAPVQTTGDRAAAWLRTVANNLVEKGKSYGDSVGNPLRIFSQAGVTEGIRVRIDDKLSRIARGKDWPGDDVVVDLVGYLALLAVTEQKK